MFCRKPVIVLFKVPIRCGSNIFDKNGRFVVFAKKMSIQHFEMFHLFNLYNKSKKYDRKVSTNLQQKCLFLRLAFLVSLFSQPKRSFLGRFVFHKKINLSLWRSHNKRKVKLCCACTDILHTSPNFISGAG